MKRHIITGLAAFVFAMGLSLILSSPSMAVHRGAGDLVCGGCHTMHNSQGNASMGGVGGGTAHLLRAANALGMCASCHFVGGAYATTQFAPANVTPPKVFLNNANFWNQTKPFGDLPAGGFFDLEVIYAGGATTASPTPVATGTNAGGYGHSVGATNQTPPGGTTFGTAKFQCVSCHDPHGTNVDGSGKTNRYRNLLVDADFAGDNAGVQFNTGAMNSWVGGITGEVGVGNFAGMAPTAELHYWPIYNGNENVSNVYGVGVSEHNGVAVPNATLVAAPDRGAMSRWCAQCHDEWHEGITTANIDTPAGHTFNQNGADTSSWKRHPIDKGVYSNETTKDGASDIDFPHYTGVAAGFKVPATNKTGNQVYYADSEGDRVMCLTCHFPHAGPYKDALRWDHANSNTEARGIPSNRGCQQCHNRGA